MGHVYGVARPTRVLSAAVALLLSIVFVTVYGAIGWFTSIRMDVATWSFAWERNIPFVPWLIVPYASLDLFFVGAPFLCADRRELRILARRMIAAILIAGAIFLLMPLRFTFPRPHVTGWTAPIFNALHGFDRPYNLFPSLHIAILAILAGIYDRRTSGPLRWLVRVWFVLIAASTVLTWQHHLVDLFGGFALAIVCFYLTSPASPPQPITRHVRIGGYYSGAAALLAGLVWWLGRPGLPLLWPAASMSMAAGAYFGLYAGIGRKHGGRLPAAARMILAPWLAGQQLSLLYYRRHAAAWSEVASGVWIGRQLQTREAASALRLGVTAVLDLTGEFSEARPFLSVDYLNLQVLDLTAPTQMQIRAAVAFINAHRSRGVVYVHCKIGYSRSATMVGCWLLDAGLAATAEEAVAVMRRARPTLVVRPEAWTALREFSRRDRPPRTAPDRLIEVRT
jgi:protein-tyrosine phosphatase/membrane-associated phospholipid phosphatase